ncbi:hypothetical protein NLG97_g1564 [Lecanicillium saksenae]|uniref:Uncharacterized protein n=1 Tax=Lecanicillium saksenae TaxID=468837 RepID=A0ACC1R4N5_9HYPO|nr:hypothetical protein NLG97_g1564 [Lecanicillium saksenae]
MSHAEKIQLPDGLAVYANPTAQFELEFIHKEIFIDKCYDVAPFPDNSFMIDAGGNIGMFALYMKKKYPLSTILAFEPVPATFSTFQRNMELHNIAGVLAHRCGLGKENTRVEMTFFPQMPGNSTLYGEDKRRQISFLDKDHPVAQLMQEQKKVEVDVKRLSDFLHEIPDLKRIDLLKVDVEGAELDVLCGLDDRHWALIDNIVVEVCDSKGDVATATTLLQSKGFSVAAEKPDWAPEELKMYMLVARRST